MRHHVLLESGLALKSLATLRARVQPKGVRPELVQFQISRRRANKKATGNVTGPHMLQRVQSQVLGQAESLSAVTLKAFQLPRRVGLVFARVLLVASFVLESDAAEAAIERAHRVPRVLVLLQTTFRFEREGANCALERPIVAPSRSRVVVFVLRVLDEVVGVVERLLALPMKTLPHPRRLRLVFRHVKIVVHLVRKVLAAQQAN